MAGLVFDSTGTLYGVTGDGGSPAETLFTISTADATSTLFLTLGNGSDGEAIAFNPDDGLMYHTSGWGTKVFETINLQTKAVTNIPLSGDIFVKPGALAYAGSGRFYLSGDYSSEKLYSIIIVGVGSFIGDMEKRVKGLLYFVPPPLLFPL